MKTMNEKMLELIKSSNSILIFTHKRPDGDAIGSALALKRIFNLMGKQAQLCCEDRVPETYSFLQDADEFKFPSEISGSFDLAISIDASDEGRLGKAYPLFSSIRPNCEIDHHATNTYFADENEVDSNAPAAGVLAFRLAKNLNVQFDEQLAGYIYTAISTDTGNFCFSGVNEEIFMQMSELMETGFPISYIARQIHLNKTLGHLKLRARALESLRQYEDAQISAMCLSKKDFEDCKAKNEDGDGIVNSGLYIKGVKLAFLGIEEDDGVKFSLRCLDGFDVSVVAKCFGGGGHRLASGCFIEDSLENAMQKVLVEMKKELKA